MRVLIASAVLAAACGAAVAQPAVPDLKGTWVGQFRTAILGNNAHHPGDQTAASPPRIREIAFTIDIEGQDGSLFWGHSWSDPASKEPFVGSLRADGKEAVVADTDGGLNIRLTGDNSFDTCYRHSGLGPSGSIVVSCGSLTRAE